MSDLHERLLAAVNARLELAHKATPGPWSASGPDTIAQWEIYDHQWSVASATAYDHNDPLSNKPGATGPGYIDADANAAFIAANDPATVIRHCEADLRILDRHSPHPEHPECCRECTWAYEDSIEDCFYIGVLATAYAINSALPAAPQPPEEERGSGSPPTPPR